MRRRKQPRPRPEVRGHPRGGRPDGTRREARQQGARTSEYSGNRHPTGPIGVFPQLSVMLDLAAFTRLAVRETGAIRVEEVAREWRNGRRAGFRCQCPKGRGGSNPPSRTQSKGTPVFGPGFLSFNPRGWNHRSTMLEGPMASGFPHLRRLGAACCAEPPACGCPVALKVGKLQPATRSAAPRVRPGVPRAPG